MSWQNLEASNGFNYSYLNSNSNFFYQIHEDSQSQNVSLFHSYRDDLIYDHTINFSNILFHQNEIKQQINSPFQPLFPSKQQIIQTNNNQTLHRKGLKSLAQLLLKILKQKALTQNQIVTQIEYILHKNNSQTINILDKEIMKEQKNIKRRIYDALNVMIAAGILQRQQLKIQLKKHSISDIFLQYEPLQILRNRIQKKRELLNHINSQKEAIQYWLQQKKANSSYSNPERHLLFPLLFLFKQDDNFSINYHKDILFVEGKKFQIFSQTDLLKKIYESKTDYTSFDIQ